MQDYFALLGEKYWLTKFFVRSAQVMLWMIIPCLRQMIPLRWESSIFVLSAVCSCCWIKHFKHYRDKHWILQWGRSSFGYQALSHIMELAKIINCKQDLYHDLWTLFVRPSHTINFQSVKGFGQFFPSLRHQSWVLSLSGGSKMCGGTIYLIIPWSLSTSVQHQRRFLM